MRFPPVRYYQISSAIAETALYSRFGGGIGKKRERGSVCRGSVRQASSELLRYDSPSQPRRFPMATKKALARSHSRSLQLLYIVGGNQARSDARSEFKKLEPSPKGGVGTGRTHHCRS